MRIRSLAVGAVVGTALVVLTSVLLGRISAADDRDPQVFTPVTVATKPGSGSDADDPDAEPTDGDDRDAASRPTPPSAPTPASPERVQQRPKVADPDGDSNPSPPSPPTPPSAASVDT